MSTISQIVPPLPPHISPETNWVYELILWRKSMTNSEEIVYRTLRFLADVDESLQAKYLYKEEFEVSREKIAEAIQKGANDMPGIGRIASNFIVATTLDSSAFAYTFSIGITHPSLCNVLIMKIPRTKVEGDNPVLRFDTLKFIFRGLVEIFEPFWGAISNNLNFQRFGQVSKQIEGFKLPSAIHWFNYFDRLVLENLDADKVFSAPFYSIERLENKGVIAILQPKPFKEREPEHLQRQEQVMQYLNFDELYRRYSRYQ
jgi:hypothetical protein